MKNEDFSKTMDWFSPRASSKVLPTSLPVVRNECLRIGKLPSHPKLLFAPPVAPAGSARLLQ